ncbi:MAG: TetR/AcrR family transcriptional regulator [Kofleriaceae bacterium]|nr:TetR/AcrR family transcriptional regulator [Kofleriaceae bacterium]
MDAALALFAERGFHGAAIPDIAERAGVAPATIYSHFAGKVELVNELYRRAKLALGAALLTSVPAAAPMRDQFAALWRALVRFAREQPRAFAFLELHHHGDYLDDASRALELRVLTPIAEVLELGRRRGVTKDLPPHPLIVTVWGAFVGMIKAARLGYFELSDDVCAQVEATCWDAIRAPAPATGETRS